MRRDQPRREGKGTIAVCAIMKNEARHLGEWIAYHRSIGVEHFYLYDNGSTDGTAALLADLVRRGIVTYRFWPRRPGQIEAYDDFAAQDAARWEWCAFIDLDEFISVEEAEPLGRWLGRFPKFAAIAIHWLNFGPSGHRAPPASLVTRAFLLRLPDGSAVHTHVKSIVRMSSYRGAITPHAFRVDGPVATTVGIELGDGTTDYSLSPIQIRGCVIAHYYTRSRQEWDEKVARGMADAAEDAPNRRDAVWFQLYEREAVIPDRRMAAHGDAIRREMALLGLDTGGGGVSMPRTP